MTVDSRSLELRHLHALIAVADERSFGRAAERLGYTQSAVSQQIASLERSVGSVLFDRPGGPKPVELTPAGVLLVEHATSIVGNVQHALDDLVRLENGEVGTLRVGSFQSVSVALVPQVVGRLLAERPHVSVELESHEGVSSLMRGVQNSTLDLAFGVGEEHGPNIETIPLFDDPFVVITPADPTHSGKAPSTAAPVTLEELSAAQIIGQPEEQCRLVADDFLRRNGVPVAYSFVAEDNGTVQAMVRSGMGYSVMPLLAVDTSDPGISVRSLEPALPSRTLCLMLGKDRTQSPAMRRFVELTIEVVGERNTADSETPPG